MAIEYLAGKRIRGTSTERGTFGISSTGLKTYLKFNEVSGNIINQATSVGSTDSLGTGADLVVTGAAYSQTGMGLGNALLFDGVDDYGVEASADTGLHKFLWTTNCKWSLAFWGKFPTLGQQTLWYNVDGTPQAGLDTVMNSSDGFNVDIRGTSSWIYSNAFNGMTGLSTNTWYHIVITYDQTLASANGKIFINGVKVDEKNKSSDGNSTSDAEYSLNYFRTPANTDFMNIIVQEWSEWNRVLTDAEITTLYNSGNGVELPNVKVQDGSIFEETDTNKHYLLDSGTWTEI